MGAFGAQGMSTGGLVLHPMAPLPSTSSEHRSHILAQLHYAMLSGSREAAAELVTSLLHMLQGRLRRGFPRVARDAREDALQEAVAEYVLHPSRFTPSKGLTIDGFVYLVAWRNLANAVASDASRRRREAEYARQTLRTLPQPPTVCLHDALLPGLPAHAPERLTLAAWLGGERRTCALAATLGLGSAPDSEQRRAVKRFKDCMLKRAGRLRARAAMHHR